MKNIGYFPEITEIKPKERADRIFTYDYAVHCNSQFFSLNPVIEHDLASFEINQRISEEDVLKNWHRRKSDPLPLDTDPIIMSAEKYSDGWLLYYLLIQPERGKTNWLHFFFTSVYSVSCLRICDIQRDFIFPISDLQSRQELIRQKLIEPAIIPSKIDSSFSFRADNEDAYNTLKDEIEKLCLKKAQDILPFAINLLDPQLLSFWSNVR